MNREKELAKNTMILTIGKFATQFISFLLLPLYTGILSTEEYGTVDIINTLVMLFLPIVSLQIEQGAFRLLIDAREEDRQEIITNVIVTIFCCELCFLGILVPVALHVDGEYFGFFGAIVIATAGFTLLLQIARGLKKNKEYSLASFIMALFTIVFNIFFLIIIKLRISGMLLGTLLGNIVGCVYLLVQLRIQDFINFKFLKKKIILNLLKYSVPLIPSSISWWIFNSSDRVLVTVMLGSSMNGILSASHKFSSAFIMIYNIFVLTWTESICVHINDTDIQEYFNKIFSVAISMFSSIAVIIVAAMPFIYDLLINCRYESGYGLVPIQFVGSMLNVSLGLMGAVYIAKKDTKSVARTAVQSAIINVLVHLWLIDFLGLYASAISTIVALVIMVLIRKREIGSKYFDIIFGKRQAFLIIISWMSVLLVYYQENSFLHLIGLNMALLFAWIINKNLIKQFIDGLKRK